MLISILDHSGVTAGQTAAAAIADSLALARHCDPLGYTRYWVSEHHGTAAVAGTAPEVLIGAIAATTRHMRIGSGGVMLPHYAALKVAEQFRVLEAIAPGRIDLGLGRAPGGEQISARALNPYAGRSGQDEFPSQLRDLLAWLAGTDLPHTHPFRSVRAEPQGGGVPAVWMLGSSDYGARIAAHFGLPYCYAHFFAPGPAADARAAQALALYRDGFRPGITARPHGAIAVTAMAADTREQAEYELGSRLLWSLRREQGVFAPFPAPRDAAAIGPGAERDWLDRARGNQIYGTGAQVADQLRDLGGRVGADELLLVTTAHDAAVRRHAYTLMASAFGLARPQTPMLSAA